MKQDANAIYNEYWTTHVKVELFHGRQILYDTVTCRQEFSLHSLACALGIIRRATLGNGAENFVLFEINLPLLPPLEGIGYTG